MNDFSRGSIVKRGFTWKTVSMARPMLSKEVIPEFGPCHFSRQMDTFVLHVYAPMGAVSSEPS